MEKSLAEGLRIKAQSEADKLRFPPCNSQWSAAGGGRVWCSTKRYANSPEFIKYEQVVSEHVLNVDFNYVPKGLQYLLLSAVVEWREDGRASQGNSSIQAPKRSVASVLKTHLQTIKTPTYRSMMVAFIMRIHALLESTSPKNLPAQNSGKQ